MLLTASIALSGCGPKRYEDDSAQRRVLIEPKAYLAGAYSAFNLYYIIDPASDIVYCLAYTAHGVSLTPMYDTDGSFLTKNKLIINE